MTGPPPFHLVVVALPDRDKIPARVRVRRWLKLGLRVFGLRLLSIGPAPRRGKEASDR